MVRVPKSMLRVRKPYAKSPQSYPTDVTVAPVSLNTFSTSMPRLSSSQKPYLLVICVCVWGGLQGGKLPKSQLFGKKESQYENAPVSVTALRRKVSWQSRALLPYSSPLDSVLGKSVGEFS